MMIGIPNCHSTCHMLHYQTIFLLLQHFLGFEVKYSGLVFLSINGQNLYINFIHFISFIHFIHFDLSLLILPLYHKRVCNVIYVCFPDHHQEYGASLVLYLVCLHVVYLSLYLFILYSPLISILFIHFKTRPRLSHQIIIVLPIQPFREFGQ